MEINIVDENEAPVFLSAPYSGTVYENKTFVQRLGKVNATDEDFNGHTVR